MIRARRSVVATVATAAALLALGAAWAAVSPTYSVSGFEVAATSIEGTFVGTGSGSGGDNLIWKAVVAHTPVSTNPATPATITGGSLVAVSYEPGTVSTLTGTFTGGTVTYNAALSSSAACGVQVFNVSGNLAIAAGAETGTGTFQVFLTHYRATLFGRCVTFAATVRGAPGLTVSL